MLWNSFNRGGGWKLLLWTLTVRNNLVLTILVTASSKNKQEYLKALFIDTVFYWIYWQKGGGRRLNIKVDFSACLHTHYCIITIASNKTTVIMCMQACRELCCNIATTFQVRGVYLLFNTRFLKKFRKSLFLNFALRHPLNMIYISLWTGLCGALYRQSWDLLENWFNNWFSNDLIKDAKYAFS